MNYTITRHGKHVIAVGAPGSLARQVCEMGLEHVLPVNHEHYWRIFWDATEGKYYDKGTDIYLGDDELRHYGLLPR